MMDILPRLLIGLAFGGFCWFCLRSSCSEFVGRADRFVIRLMGVLFGVGGLLILIGLATQAYASPPHAADKYRALLTRTAHAVVGLDAPIATFAAQIQQESAWQPHAQSGVGAKGLAQFMPATAQWMGQLDRSLSPAKVFNPRWAIRAMVVYDAWLLERVRAINTCNEWAFALSAYNGGLSWVYRDKQLASRKSLDKRVWFNSVERVNSGRSTANWVQNRDYPKRILLRNEPVYVSAGWGHGVCEGVYFR